MAILLKPMIVVTLCVLGALSTSASNNFFLAEKRRVPSGSDPIESPATPFAFNFLADKRKVPHGPDPIESPPTPVAFDFLEEKRKVPHGPDPIEPPPTPVSFNFLSEKRKVPHGPDPIESPPTPVAFDFLAEKRKVPHGPDPIESPPTPFSFNSKYMIPYGSNRWESLLPPPGHHNGPTTNELVLERITPSNPKNLWESPPSPGDHKGSNGIE